MDKKTKEITKEEVEYLANLARLFLTEQEKENLPEELAKIIEYISLLSNVEAPVSSKGNIPITNVFRKDEVKNSISQKEILSGAPERKDNFLKVPRII